MAPIHTHYDNLKVARNAPAEVIRAAYKTLSQKYHPDRHPENAHALHIIQMINLAYDVLSDPVKRQAHDEWILKAERKQDIAGQTPVFFSSDALLREERSFRIHRKKHSRLHPLRHVLPFKPRKLWGKARRILAQVLAIYLKKRRNL